MEGRPLLAQLQHVPQDQQLLAAWRRDGGEHFHRRVHRGDIGVVALVDQHQRSLGRAEPHRLGPAPRVAPKSANSRSTG